MITITTDNTYAGGYEISTQINSFFADINSMPVSTKKIIVRNCSFEFWHHVAFIKHIHSLEFLRIRRKYTNNLVIINVPDIVFLMKFIPENIPLCITVKHTVKRTETGQICTLILI